MTGDLPSRARDLLPRAAPCHSDRMRIDEAAMACGIALRAPVALRCLAGSVR